MQGKRYNQPWLVQEINIEAIVPHNYILRHIDKAVDLSFIRERTKKLYSRAWRLAGMSEMLAVKPILTVKASSSASVGDMA